jgi:hypothetical protein
MDEGRQPGQIKLEDSHVEPSRSEVKPHGWLKAAGPLGKEGDVDVFALCGHLFRNAAARGLTSFNSPSTGQHLPLPGHVHI